MLLPKAPNVPKVDIDSQTLIVYGDPKVGKTMLMNGAPDALFISTEGRCNHVTSFKVDITTWKEFEEVLKELPAHSCKTVILDTVSNLWKFAEEDYCKTKGIKTLLDERFCPGYAVCETNIHRALLYVQKHKRLIMICHAEEKEFEVDLPNGSKTIKSRMAPDAYKRLHQVMKKLCTLEVYMRMVNGKRTIHPNASERWEAGSALPVGSLKLPDSIEIIEGASGYETLKAAYESALKPSCVS